MRLAFWEAMVQDGVDPYQLRQRFTTKISFIQLIKAHPGFRAVLLK
jgi:hypothetical protein